MEKSFNYKTVKIKEEYKVVAKGRVVDFVYSGYTYILHRQAVAI